MRPAARHAPLAAPAGRSVPQVTRPTWLDYVLILAGCVLSLLLAQLSGLQAETTPQTPAKVYLPLVALLPQALFLPLGIILLWPILYATQRVTGRAQPLTAGEWLLGLAWLAALVLGGGIVWQHSGTLPEFLGEYLREYLVMGHVLGALALAALAAVVWLIDLVGRWAQPWTDRLGLALLMWPAAPLALLWFWHLKLLQGIP
jgi:hypothetical protein